jgi:hypothetical protein
MRKKKWTTPRLTVLVRGKPEESVLCACKGGFAGPTSNTANCTGGAPSCAVCNSTSGS